MTALRQNIAKLKDSTIDWIYSKRNLVNSMNDKREILPYAYPCSNYVEKVLSNKLVCKALQSVFDEHYCKQIEQVKAASQIVTPISYPNLYGIMNACCELLMMTNCPVLMVNSRLKNVNGLTIGSDKEPVILLSRKAVTKLNEGELKFLIGHELGHVLQQNLVCHIVKGGLDNLKNSSDVLGTMIADVVEMPLNQWHRCSEITSDRAGFICCQKMDHVKEIFMKIGKPLNKVSGSSVNNALDNLFELNYRHPMIAKRLLSLECFEKSSVFNAFCSGEKIDISYCKSLNEKVQTIML